jgi:threonine/homoserine/homoserine lactone efflux protein
MAGAIWKAFVFGALVAGAIGPIALLIFGTGARQGFAAGAVAGLGAALADFLYALGALLAGAILLPLLAGHEQPIRAGGALLLVGLAAFMLFGLMTERAGPQAARPVARALLPTFLLTVVNPMTFVMFAGIVPQLPVTGSFALAAGLAIALASGSAAVNVAIGGAGAALGKALPGAGARRAITAAAALGIFAFGIVGLLAALQASKKPIFTPASVTTSLSCSRRACGPIG